MFELSKLADQIRKKVFTRSFTKYLGVGVTAFLVEYFSFSFLLSTGLRLAYANSLSFILGLLTSFLLNKYWAFRVHTHAKRTHHQLAIYIGLALLNLILTNLIVELMVGLNISAKVAKLLAMVITSTWNYVIFKIIIFKYKITSLD